MRPRILVTCSLNDHEAATRTLVAYCDPVVTAGGLPLIAPAFTDPAVVAEALDHVQGVLLIGGPDYHPEAYGGRPQPVAELVDRRRHDADLLLARLVMDRDMPVLGICGGLQALVIAGGGALVQDIPTDWPNARVHNTPGDDVILHDVRTVAGTRLQALAGECFEVNSYHHQAARPDRLGGFTVSAVSDDGIIEAVERADRRFCLGVQWHPERMPRSASSLALFAALIETAQG